MSKKVLIIDDDQAIVDALYMILQMEGYVCESASEYVSMDEIKTIHPDVVLLDIWMSGVDGRYICRQLKSNKITKDITVIIVSADKDIRTLAKEARADDFLEKPFDLTSLLKKVKKYTVH
ncbi:response regulator transcription factor [Candidatus Roizmanbacteria bacterium]|nr:response regulator transcription factor [Candidatus Roizmanbacteria bacterium]